MDHIDTANRVVTTEHNADLSSVYTSVYDTVQKIILLY